MRTKVFDLNYFITLLFLLLSANANILSSGIIGWAAVIFLMIIVAVNRKDFNKKEILTFSYVSAGFVLLVLIRFFLINDQETDYLMSDFLYLIKYIFVSFLFCLLLKDKLLANIVKVMTHLTLLSFVFYAWQLLSADSMFRMFSALNVNTGNSIPGYTNILLFTFTEGFHNTTNSGFVWEPGAFGCFLVFTLMFHFFLNKFKIDKIAILFIIANITTFSTTNYLGLLILFFLVYRYRSPKINIYVLILVPAIILAFIFIPFLGNKILDTYQEDMRDLNHLKVLQKYYHHNRMDIPLNRFSSMVYIYETFGNKLILGVSNRYNDILNKSYTVNISNGVFDFLAKFGLVGLLFLLVKYVEFCKPYVLRWENIVYCVLIILTLSFGEPILFLPIVMMFLFIKPKQKSIKKYENREDEEEETPGSHLNPRYARGRA